MNLYEILDKLNIKYDELVQEAVYTIEEANKIESMIEGIGCKNLFLTDKNKYFLYVLKDDKRADLKELAKYLNVLRLSFGNEDKLMELLGLTKGSVTPLGIINDKDNKVTVILDKDLVNCKLLCHPNTNTKTMNIEYEDLIKLIEYTNHKYIIY